uniref:Cystine knot toxin n=1 Tax=Dolomedes sulfureus TaxID=492288 RepID=A0A0P0DIN6_9ARAC|nr:cystine knot toxin [Dolomedes sulfureus]
MKATLAFLVFLGLVGISLAWTACTKQSDCEEDECCLDNFFFKRPYCEKRYGAEQRCSATATYKEENDLYYFTCPCVRMYECFGKGTTDENGNTIMKDPKCIMPTR